MYHAIFVQRPLHTIYELDVFLANANRNLDNGGYLVCNCRTSAVKKAVIYRRYPKGINRIYYGVHYIWHRVFPKIKGLKEIYFAVTKGRNRTFHRVEILGRLYHAGFSVIYENTAHGEFRVVAKKVKEAHGITLDKDAIYSGDYDDYVQEAVEDIIIDEMGMELAFEGTRFFDLSRVAMRRNDPTYLAKHVAMRNGTMDMTLYNYLSASTKNWYLPLPE